MANGLCVLPNICQHKRNPPMRSIQELAVGLSSQDIEPLPCNCRTGATGACGDNNMCSNSMVICKVKCNNTQNVQQETHNALKSRMQQHFNEVQKLVTFGKKSDSCTKHFVTRSHNANLSHLKQRGSRATQLRSVVKTCATKNCAIVC